MTKSHLLSFIFGAAAVLGINMIGQSKAEAPNHVFELRTYHAAPGKLDALVARFRDHTDTMFKKYELKTVGYWIPQDNTDNVFIYIVEHKSKADADKNWAAFQADEAWKKVRTESEVNGPLQTKVDRVFMSPTDFSKLK